EPSLFERWTKWRRRHPRLTSLTTLAVVGAVLVGGVATFSILQVNEANARQRVANQQLVAQGLEKAARETLAKVPPEAQDVQERLTGAGDVGVALERGRKALALYGVGTDPGWQETNLVRFLPAEAQGQVKQEVGDFLLVMVNAQKYLTKLGRSGKQAA